MVFLQLIETIEVELSENDHRKKENKITNKHDRLKFKNFEKLHRYFRVAGVDFVVHDFLYFLVGFKDEEPRQTEVNQHANQS